MSQAHHIRTNTTNISKADLEKVLDSIGVEVSDIKQGLSKNNWFIAEGIIYVSTTKPKSTHNRIAHAIQKIVPTASISTRLRKVGDDYSYRFETKPKCDVNIITVVRGGVITGAYATKGSSVNFEVLDIDDLESGDENTFRLQELSDQVDHLIDGTDTSMAAIY